MTASGAETSPKAAAPRSRDGALPPGYRPPPHNYEAEQALLGALIENNLAYERVAEFLKPEHFADAIHGRIYEAIGHAIARGGTADLVTLKNFFESDGGLSAVGGQKYLAQLVASVVTVINAPDYARTIRDLYLRRQLIGLGTEIVNGAYRHGLETGAEAMIEAAEGGLYALAERGVGGGPEGVGGAAYSAVLRIEAAHKRDGSVVGLPTGFHRLDMLTGGMHKGEMIVLAARPSMGKTALATDIAMNVATGGLPLQSFAEKRPAGADKIVLMFSIEMSKELVAMRILARDCDRSVHSLRRGDLGDSPDLTMEMLIAAQGRLANVPLAIDDSAALTMAAVRTRARRWQRRHGLDLVIVDYLQLALPPDGAENRTAQVTAISAAGKALARELDIPVLMLSQLSRAVEARDDKRPQLADLRDSGAIEQDADGVWLLFREEYYVNKRKPRAWATPPEKRTPQEQAKIDMWESEMSPVRGKAELIVDKNRNGPTDIVPLAFNGRLMTFANATE